MSERKVQNVWIPPDFDPAKSVKKQKKAAPSGRKQTKVRLMAPFTMQCLQCATWLPKSTKFNARKEIVQGEDYLGIRIYRFYIRCTRCGAEITFKTDPKNADYVCENNAVRHFEPERRVIPDVLEGEEEVLDTMQQLEERTKQSKREMEILDALDEIRTRNSQMEQKNTDNILEKLHADPAKTLEEEDAEYARLVFSRKIGPEGVVPIWDDEEEINRIDEDEEEEAKQRLISGLRETLGATMKSKRIADDALEGIVKKKSVKPSKPEEKPEEMIVKKKVKEESTKKEPVKPVSTALSLVADYSDSE